MSDLSGIFADPIILNILTRLPAKSLCRFRSVSTRWNSVITQPQFVTSYLSRHSPTWFTLDRVVRFSRTRSEPDPIRFNLNSNSGVFILTVNPHLLLKPGEPVSGPTRYPIPAEMLHSSNGLVLFAVNIDPDPSKVETRDVLFVANPITKEWARLPSPSWDLDWLFGIILMTRPGPVGEFVVGAFVHDPDSGGCSLTCYGSETGKWVKKDVGNPVGSRVWFATYRFEFRGKMCCSDTNFGIIIWEEDPFVGCLSEEKAVCGFIPLPRRRARHTLDSEMKRCVDGAGEWRQYMEMFTEGEIALEVWRLKDWKEGEWDWELVYKVPKLVLDTFWGGDNWVGNVVFVNPYNPDVVIINGIVYIYSLDVRTGVVKSCRSFTGHMCGMPCVVPSWPPSLPPRLCKLKS